MARPKNADILAAYKRELDRSRKWRKHDDYDDLWRRMIDLYRGRHFKTTSSDDRIVVNMAFATINVVSPAVAVNYPKITVNARHPDHAPQAIHTETIVNYEWRHGHFQTQFRRAVDDQLICGHGWLKVGYKYAQVPATPAVPPDDNEPEIATEGSEVAEDVSTETNLIVTEDRPILERISPFDVFVDPDARTPEEMRWIAQRIRRPINDVKKDRRYSKKARDEASSTSRSRWDHGDGTNVPTSGQEPDAEHLGYVDVWEWWDLKTETVCTFTREGDDFLINPKPSPYPFGQPFYMMRNYEVPDEFYPMGELEAIEILQLELNETRTQMLNHRKRFSRKWLYTRGHFDDDGIAALKSADDNVMVPVETDGQPGNSIAPLPAVITPPEFYNQSQMIQDDMDTVSGVSEYMRGVMPEVRRTATEAAMLQDAQNARSADKLARIETSLGRIAERVVQVMQTFLTGEHVVRIIGPDGLPAWLQYDRDYIQGEFDFEVEAGSTQPMNESFRRQSALQMIDALAPMAAILNLPELAKLVLNQGFGIKNPDKYIVAPTEPGNPAAQGGPPPPPGGEMAALPPGAPPQPM